jgi:hypothetical protein
MKYLVVLTRRKNVSSFIAFLVAVLVVVGFNIISATGNEPTTRDKFLWPFASTSIWNMPIGSDAKYVYANIGKAKQAAADPEYFYKLNAGDPLRKVYAPGAWGKGRCTGDNYRFIELPISDDLIIPDATNEPLYTPNNAAAFLMPDDRTLVQLGPVARCEKGGAIYGWRSFPDVDIYSDGINGGHFGSGLSSIGGSIRKGELIGDQPIRHALKILLWGEKYLYYSQSIPGFRWPATNADNGAANQYRGQNPTLVQGSLLAIPPTVTPESINIQTEPGKKLFRALQDFGAYVVDDAGWDAHYFATEKGVVEEFRTRYGYDFEGTSGTFYDDFMSLFQALNVVDNNTQNTIGGGGIPRGKMAPPIVN